MRLNNVNDDEIVYESKINKTRTRNGFTKQPNPINTP